MKQPLVDYKEINPEPIDVHFLRSTPFEQVINYDHVSDNGERRLKGATIDDRLYGRFDFDNSDPGDATLLEIIQSEAFGRLWHIEQLILPQEFATRPETVGFNRYEHSMGVMLLTRMLGGSKPQQIRALVHDLPQTAFSHLGDWRKQGMDGSDDYHDSILEQYLRQWGIDDILERHGFSLGEITDKTIEDFVERPAPDLCADRVDYSLREFARWTCPDDVPYLISQLAVRDDMIVLETAEAARLFGNSYLDLFWQHWAENEHALKEKLFLTMVNRGMEIGALREADMYGTDQVAMIKLEWANDPIINELWWIMSQKGLDLNLQRGMAENFDPQNLAQEVGKLYVPMRQFKPRWVDPSFAQEDGSVIRLSMSDLAYRTRLDTHLDVTNDSWFMNWAIEHGSAWQVFVALAVEQEAKLVLSGHADLL